MKADDPVGPTAATSAQQVVRLIDRTGEWTHRDRHQHHHFDIEVPDGTVEIRIRFRSTGGPLDLAPEHQQNSLAMSLFGPGGFRGAAPAETRGDQQVMIGESTASLGALAGPIPPGTWTINVDTGEILNDGLEPGFLAYHVEATATIGGAAAPLRTPPRSAPSAAPRPTGQTDGPRWYRGDLHSHTVHSDGIITVEDRVRGAVERGMDFLAITDHNTVSHHAEIVRWPPGITAIRASEVTTFHGHMNCFGLTTTIDWRNDTRGTGAAGILEQAHRQNALISINHPNAFGDPWCTGCHWDFALVDFAAIDAIEVWNGRWAIPESDNLGALAFWTDLLDAGFRPTAISGSDSHSAEEDQYVALPMTYVHAADRSEAAILDGIRRGRVFLSSGPTISFRARGSDGMEVTVPGGPWPADGALDLTAAVENLQEAATLWFVTSGSRVPLGALERGGATVRNERLSATKWWRLELRGGSSATGDILVLTNPSYLA